MRSLHPLYLPNICTPVRSVRSQSRILKLWKCHYSLTCSDYSICGCNLGQLSQDVSSWTCMTTVSTLANRVTTSNLICIWHLVSWLDDHPTDLNCPQKLIKPLAQKVFFFFCMFAQHQPDVYMQLQRNVVFFVAYRTAVGTDTCDSWAHNCADLSTEMIPLNLMQLPRWNCILEVARIHWWGDGGTSHAGLACSMPRKSAPYSRSADLHVRRARLVWHPLPLELEIGEGSATPG